MRKSHVTVSEAGRALGLCPETIRRYLKRELIRGFRTPSASKFGGRWRIPREEIDRFRETYQSGQGRLPHAEIDGLRLDERPPENEAGIEIIEGPEIQPEARPQPIHS